MHQLGTEVKVICRLTRTWLEGRNVGTALPRLDALDSCRVCFQ